MKDYKKIEVSLKKLEEDFHSQVNALGNNSNDFHNALIELTSKYPEHKELLQFIVHINDKLEMNHNIFSEVITGTFNEMLRIKKELLNKIIEDLVDVEVKPLKNLTKYQKVIKFLKGLSEVKIVFISIAVMVMVFGLLVAPDIILSVIETIINIK